MDLARLERATRSLRRVFWFVSVVSYPAMIVLLLLVGLPIGAALLAAAWLVAVPLMWRPMVRTPARRLADARAAQSTVAGVAFGR